jgi:aryl-alcohol dehydrogenase-like predicted oxidoreductase
MEHRTLGGALEVTALGLGCMGMSQSYGAGDDVESIATMELALERGLNFFDTADVYGQGKNEELLAKVLATHRDEIVLATKFGNVVTPGAAPGANAVNGRPEYVRQACEDSLRRLGVSHIDLYYQHRIDKTVPIEETWGALSELVAAGKVRHLGISEASAATVRRAHAVHPITASQSEYSLFTRDLEEDLIPTLRELGIGLVAYSPIGRGFLSGTITSPDQFEESDNRRNHPRFQGENFQRNLDLVEKIHELANDKGVTSSQLAIAWVLAQGDDVVPIPGTKRRRYLEENLGALDVELSEADLAAIEAVAPRGAVVGDRYPTAQMSRVNV